MKNLHIYIFVILVSIAAFACSEKAEISNSNKNDLVLILNSSPNNLRCDSPNSSSLRRDNFLLTYIDDNNILKKWSPNMMKRSDTLTIHSKRDYIDITHLYRGIDKLYYLFQRGDTVVFNYCGKKPQPIVRNRSVKKHDLNYGLTIRKLIYKDNFPAGLAWYLNYNIPKSEMNKFYFDDFHKKLSDCERKRFIRDSLFDHNLLSKSVYRYYNMVDEYSIFFSKVKKDLGYSLNNRNPKANLETLSQYKLFNSFRKNKKDSLIYFMPYNDFVFGMYSYLYKPKLPLVKTSNSIFRDYRVEMDSIIKLNTKIFSVEEEKIFALFALDNLVNHFSNADSYKYLNVFLHKYNDTLKYKYILNKYQIGKNVSKDLCLLDVNKRKIIFEDLLKKNRGKLIYVDFWASWCSPCRAAMKYSRILEKEYHNKNVLFLYLSRDSDFDVWRATSRKEALGKSYVIENFRNSSMIQDLKINLIPRYLLFDKGGVLVHKNAPGPKGKEVRKLFDRYLKHLL